jgi:hypothetical protein
MSAEHPRQRLARRTQHEVDTTVALCTFNGARWLPELFSSIAAQTRRPGEIVVQDDGSTDGTLDVIERARAELPCPVRLEVNEQRLGSTRNFEVALARCNGRVVALADQDDVWYPRKLERLMEEFDLDPTVTMVFSDADLIDEQGRRLGRRLWDSRLIGRVLRMNPVVAGDMFARRALTTGCTMALHRRAVAASLPFPDELADPDTPMRHDRWLSLVAAGVGTVRPLPEALLAFRVHPAQETGVLSRSELARALGRASLRAMFHHPQAESAGHVTRSRQLLVAAERAEELGDFDGARRLRDVAAQHRRRLLTDASVLDRLRSVRTGMTGGLYGHDVLGWASVAADAARAVRPRRGRRHLEDEG